MGVGIQLFLLQVFIVACLPKEIYKEENTIFKHGPPSRSIQSAMFGEGKLRGLWDRIVNELGNGRDSITLKAMQMLYELKQEFMSSKKRLKDELLDCLRRNNELEEQLQACKNNLTRCLNNSTNNGTTGGSGNNCTNNNQTCPDPTANLTALCRERLNGAQLVTLSTGKYVFFSPETAASGLTWDEARMKCQSMGLDLVTINSAAEESAVTTQYSTLSGDANQQDFWISLRRASSTDPWLTPNGDPIGFDNFETTGGGANALCAMDSTTSGSTGFEWRARNCGTRSGYVCELGGICAQYL